VIKKVKTTRISASPRYLPDQARRHGLYLTEREQSTWLKIRNRSYSQMAGREELCERERHSEPMPGWHSSDIAGALLEVLS